MKKYLSLMICLALLAVFAVSCAGEEPTSVTESSEEMSEAESSAEESLPEEQSYVPDIYDGKDYAGRTFTVFSTYAESDPVFEFVYNEDLDEELLSESVNLAIKARNDKVYDKLGVEIKEEFFRSGRYGNEVLSQVRSHISGGLDEYSLYSLCLYDCATLATEGELYDLNGLENLNTKNPWWEQYFNDTVSIFGKLYFTIGDMTFNTMGSIHCIYYNADLIRSLGLEDPIDVANAGKWTIDKAIEYSKQYVNDSAEPEGRMDYKDEFGWGGQDSDAYFLLYGTGVRAFSAEDAENAVLSINNETTINTIEKCKELMKGEWYCRGNDYFSVTSAPMDLIQDAFEEGRCMFFSHSLYRTISLDMNDEFGILPLPKYNEEQDEYYSMLSTWRSNAYCIAANLSEEDAEFSAAVLDVLGYYSWKEHGDSVCTNYYQKTLKNQKLVTEKSEAMLDLIYQSVGCDLAGIFRIGELSGNRALNDTLIDIVNGVHENFTSAYEKFEPTYQADLETVLDFFRQN